MHGKDPFGGVGYANSAEFFDEHLAHQEYNPYYYWGNGPWYIDSGATTHIASDPQKLDRAPTTSGIEINEIKTGGGESHLVKGSNSATIQTENGAIKLKNVKYVPNMKKNLISIGAIVDHGHRVVFSSNNCWIIDKQDHTVATGHIDPTNGLYYFTNQEKHCLLRKATSCYFGIIGWGI